MACANQLWVLFEGVGPTLRGLRRVLAKQARFMSKFIKIMGFTSNSFSSLLLIQLVQFFFLVWQ